MTFKKKVVQGMFWVALSSGLVQFIKFAVRVILTRILLPEDFGLVTIGLFVVGCFSLLQGLGINVSLIQRRHDGDIRHAADTAFILVIATGALLCGFSFFLAVPLAVFFSNAAAAGIIRLLSFTFIISSLEVIPAALLTREIEFRKRFFPEVSSTIIFAVVSISLAAAGYRYWSLVYGYMASVAVSAGFMWILSGYRPRFTFDAVIARELLRYGKFIAASTIVAFFMLQSDTAIVGKVLGTAALGFYSMAFTVANLPATSVGALFAGALFPVFSKLQSDTVKLRSFFLRSCRILSFLMVPVSVGMFMLSHEFVRIVAGERWVPMTGPLQVLCFFAIFRSMQGLVSFLLQAVGRAKEDFLNTLVQAVCVVVIVVACTLYWGIQGTSLAVTLISFIGFITRFRIVQRAMGISWRELMATLGVPFFSSAIMVCGLWAVKHTLPPVTSIPVLIGVCLAGAVMYIFSILLIDRSLLAQSQEVMQILMDKNKVVPMQTPVI
jgi:O-antigen/teichoic acid export membrane protein